MTVESWTFYLSYVVSYASWGIAWAPACGLAMAELILDGESRSVDLRPFDPARYTPTSLGRGGRGRKKGSMNVGEQW
jgi:hypothetical protein